MRLIQEPVYPLLHLCVFNLYFQLMTALRDQELCNQKLRSYIDNILSRVIEIYPEILEINRASPSHSS